MDNNCHYDFSIPGQAIAKHNPANCSFIFTFSDATGKVVITLPIALAKELAEQITKQTAKKTRKKKSV